MGNVIIVICVWAFLYMDSVSTKRSHSIWLQKIDKPILNEKWIGEEHIELKRLNKNAKSFSGNMTVYQGLHSKEVMCEIKIFQKSGPKYQKAPIDFSKEPCCEFIKKNQVVWPCIQTRSSFPKECPILEGVHWVKDLNPDDCLSANHLPPNLPEDYKAILILSKDLEQIIKLTVYAKLKKIIVLV